MNRTGSVATGMMLALLIFSTFAFGTWGVLRRWRHLVELQQRLDLCVGRAALDLRDRLDRIGKLNDKIRRVREALAVSTLAPEARPPLQVLLEALVLKQDYDRSVWAARQARWAVGLGCDGPPLQSAPLPSLALVRPPRDTLGPGPLAWRSGTAPTVWLISARARPRLSTAQVTQRKGQLANGKQYSAAWTSGTGLY